MEHFCKRRRLASAHSLAGSDSQLPRVLLQILQRLGAIISAATMIVDRLKFLHGLRIILFDHEAKGRLKERSQLHKILETNTWIFGEKFNLWASDRELKTVLKTHKEKLDPELVIDEPVKLLTRKRGIVDLMLSRSQKRHRADDYGHLVVEIPWTAPSPYRRREIILGEGGRPSAVRPMRAETRALLIDAFSQRLLLAGRADERFEPHHRVHRRAREEDGARSIRLTLSLAFLSPTLVKAAIEGRLSRGFGVKRLMDLPMGWSDQWSALGLKAPAQT
jgi:hypothetical protein